MNENGYDIVASRLKCKENSVLRGVEVAGNKKNFRSTVDLNRVIYY